MSATARGSGSRPSPRTIADIAPRLTDVELTRAIHEARRNRDLSDYGLARLYALCPRAARVFDSDEAPSRSIFQHTFRAFLELRGFPIPVFEARWHGLEVDAYYADHTLIIELDGYATIISPTGSRPTANVTSSRSHCVTRRCGSPGNA